MTCFISLSCAPAFLNTLNGANIRFASYIILIANFLLTSQTIWAGISFFKVATIGAVKVTEIKIKRKREATTI